MSSAGAGKVGGKKTGIAKMAKEKRSKGAKPGKRRKRRTETFSLYIYKVIFLSNWKKQKFWNWTFQNSKLLSSFKNEKMLYFIILTPGFQHVWRILFKNKIGASSGASRDWYLQEDHEHHELFHQRYLWSYAFSK